MPAPIAELGWMQHAPYPILAALQLLPLAGALLVLALGERRLAVVLGRVFALAALALAIDLRRHVDAASPVLQLAERLPLIGYHAAADGITTLFALLAALITVLLTLYTLVRGLASQGRLMAAVLAAEATMMTALTTTNLLWFAAAMAAEILLAAFLLRHWATSTEEYRSRAMASFLQYQSLGWLMLVAGMGIVAWNFADASGGDWSFDLVELQHRPAPGKFQAVAFFLMFYGLAVRTPLFPVHGWLPRVAHRGMIAVAPALLLGVKLGLYGMLRFLPPLMPQAVSAWHGYVVAFAMAGIFFAAALALLQTNLRRLLSFAVVSHTSLIVIGLFSLHPAGIQGGLLLSVNFGLAVTVMLFMAGFVFTRTRTTDLDRLGGLFDRIPFIGGCFLIGGLAIIGMPGTPGFDAVHLVLEAAIERFGALPTVAAALGNVAAAGFLLWAFQRAFLAPAHNPERVTAIERTLPMEYLVGGIAVAVLLAAGFYLEPWMHLTDAAAKAIAAPFGGAPLH